MIYSLNGLLADKTHDMAVIVCGGVGYAVSISANTASTLPDIGDDAFVFTVLSVKESGVELYGFASIQEREAFKLLCGVSGVGAKVGFSVLSTYDADRFALLAASGDYKALTACPGVGQRLAQRIVLELKGKFTDTTLSGVTIEDISAAASATGNVSQALSALVALGYTQSQAATAVAKLDTNADVQTLIKQALRLIAGGKI